MSRNLSKTYCDQCHGDHKHVVLEEEPRLVTEKDVGSHYWSTGAYNGLLVANAKCLLCHALYLAWVDWPQERGGSWCWDLKQHEGKKFVDLSYRHSFDDEPAIEDTPLFEIETITLYIRKPANRLNHPYRHQNHWPKEYLEKQAEELARWEERQKQALHLPSFYMDDCNPPKK